MSHNHFGVMIHSIAFSGNHWSEEIKAPDLKRRIYEKTVGVKMELLVTEP